MLVFDMLAGNGQAFVLLGASSIRRPPRRLPKSDIKPMLYSKVKLKTSSRQELSSEPKDETLDSSAPIVQMQLLCVRGFAFNDVVARKNQIANFLNFFHTLKLHIC